MPSFIKNLKYQRTKSRWEKYICIPLNQNFLKNIAKFKIRYFEKFDDDLEKIWTDLENSDITFFQTYKWQKYWHKECGANVKSLLFLYMKIIN